MPELSFLICGGFSFILVILSFFFPSLMMGKRVAKELEPWPKKKILFMLYQRVICTLMSATIFICAFISEWHRVRFLLAGGIFTIMISLLCNKIILGRLTVRGWFTE